MSTRVSQLKYVDFLTIWELEVDLAATRDLFETNKVL